jgi:hypothetical protein
MEAAEAKQTLVEVWCGASDDVFTAGLRDALENAFNSSADFSLSFGKKPDTLIVLIPEGVKWNRVGKKTQVFYTVKFLSVDNKLIEVTTGSCWDDKLAKCAAKIVKNARVAVRKNQN